MTTEATKIQSITIIGKKWFDRINGNTYFSAIGLVNGKEVVSIPYEYGYDNPYIDCIQRELEKLSLLPGLQHYNNGSNERLWQYCDRMKIELHSYSSNVKRKKDL